MSHKVKDELYCLTINRSRKYAKFDYDPTISMWRADVINEEDINYLNMREVFKPRIFFLTVVGEIADRNLLELDAYRKDKHRFSLKKVAFDVSWKVRKV